MSPTQQQNRAATELRIIDAAAQLFSQQGYQGTSTRDIAQAAGVNEVTIFRYFTRKKDLFWRAVEARASRLRVSKRLRDAVSADAEPEIVLAIFVELLVDFAKQRELLNLLHFASLEARHGPTGIYRKYFEPIVELMVGYLGRAVECGNIRQIDPLLTVMAISGSVIAHRGIPLRADDGDDPLGSTAEASENYTAYWLEALKPANPPPSPRCSACNGSVTTLKC